MFSRSFASVVARLVCCTVLGPGLAPAQEPKQEITQQPGSPQKYKLTILEGASTSKRIKKGRVSSQAVVKVTDSNNVPVPGVTVTFMLSQYGTGGAAFANGSLTSIVSTNAAGVASSGSISAAAGSSFSVSVAASVPGGVLTAAVPITTAATATAAAGAAAGGAAAGAGISTGVIVGIAAAVVGGAVAAVALKGKSSSSSSTTGVTVTISGTIGAPGTPTFGHP